MDLSDNQLILTGRLLKPAQLRTTPAGIPIARFVIGHRSRRAEAGHLREVECRIGVVASGSHLTEIIAAQVCGGWCRVRGFLDRAGYRSPDMRIELHATDIEIADQAGLQEE